MQVITFTDKVIVIVINYFSNKVFVIVINYIFGQVIVILDWNYNYFFIMKISGSVDRKERSTHWQELRKSYSYEGKQLKNVESNAKMIHFHSESENHGVEENFRLTK